MEKKEWIYKLDPKENEGQLQSSLGEFFKKQNEVK